MKRLLHRGPPAESDQGLTVVELMVTILLLAVVGSVTTAGVVTALQTQRRQVARSIAISETNTAFERVTRELRAATVLVADDHQARFTIDDFVNGVERTLDYQIVTVGGVDRLVVDEETQDTATGIVTVVPQRVVLDSLVSTPGQATFTWYEPDGGLLVPPVALTEIGRVELRLEVALPENGGTVALQNEISLRNAGS